MRVRRLDGMRYRGVELKAPWPWNHEEALMAIVEDLAPNEHIESIVTSADPDGGDDLLFEVIIACS